MTENAETPLMIMGCDQHYCFPLAVAMFSALRSASRPLRVLVLSDGISDEGKSRLKGVAQRGGAASFDVLDVDLTQFKAVSAGMSHLSVAAFSRILIPQLLPNEHRCLWIDSDTLTGRDLVELWNENLHEKLAGAGQCYYVPNVSAPYGISYVKEISDNPKRAYFNSGILVLDLDRWREADIDQAVKNFLLDYGGSVVSGDQDILNTVLIDRWEKLPGHWNDQEAINRKSAAYRDRSTKTIRHFSGPQKPWNSGLLDTDVRRWIKTAAECGFYSPLDFLFWRLMRLPLVLKVSATNWLKRKGF